MGKTKRWDITLKRFRGIEILAETKEEACILAQAAKDSDEQVGVINEIEVDE